MSLEKRKRTVRWDEETFAFESDLLSAFAPFAEDPSHLSRLVYRIFHRIVRTKGMVEIVSEYLQRQQRETLSDQLELDFSACATAGKKPPCRVTPQEGPTAAVRRLAYSATSVDGAKATYRITPLLLFKSTPVRELAA